jgi:phenylalanyl-tRNA synthetase beta chain
MKFSEQWLREWVDPAVSTAELAEQLTMAGLEVDAIEPVAAEFSGVVVGKVQHIEPHPQADRLQVCQVDIGLAAALSIVCGARNVVVGMRVPTACIGAVLPGGLKIKKTKLRGVESQGMLCSAAELGLAEHAEGLLALGDHASPGEDIRDYLQLDDVSIELGLTPNRSDCLSIAGVAREIGVLNRCTVAGPVIDAVTATSEASFPVQVDAIEACPRYLGRVISGIRQDVKTPLWLQERLRRCGSRSISPIVDVTNYVMLELGQPMHAFDLERLSAGVTIRMARAGEQLTLLDEQQLILDEQSLVIADQQGPLALAGVMGGLDSAVSETTTSLFLEAAFFAPAVITGKARSYGLHTDSSHRFERGVDPELPRRAMERATALLLEIVGGQAGEIIEVMSERHLPVRPSVTLRAARLQRLLGMSIAATEVTSILQSLGMQISAQDEQCWQLQPPSFRFDIAIEADLIEEVARIHGYGQLPVSQPQARMAIHADNGAQVSFDQQVRDVLVRRDYQEAICYSFIAEDLQRLLDPEQQPIALANPLSADLSVMRTSLWPGLVQALQYNLNRQHRRVRLFETGVRFIKQGEQIVEEKMIAGVACGDYLAEQWGVVARPLDFFDLKADVEALLALLFVSGGHAAKARFVAAEHPVLHPGQSAAIRVVGGPDEGALIGWCGLLHPAVLAELSLDGDVFVFELQLDGLRRNQIARFQPLSRFPAIRRDLAIVIDEKITAQQVQDCIADVGGELLREMLIFDVYTGKGIDSGAKSLAIGLTLQDFSRTLTDSEVEALVDRVLGQLNMKLGATLRE